jgi:hypothetical protein
MMLFAFFITLRPLQAKAYSSLLPILFKSQLNPIQTGLVVHSLDALPQVLSFSLAQVLFPSTLRSNIRSLIFLLKLSIGLLLPLPVNLHGSKLFYMILTFIVHNPCSYIVTTKQPFILLRILFSTSVQNV